MKLTWVKENSRNTGCGCGGCLLLVVLLLLAAYYLGWWGGKESAEELSGGLAEPAVRVSTLAEP